MTNRHAIYLAIRAWFQAALSLTDAQIIKANQKGPRPALPYLTIKVTVADIPQGVDESIREFTVGPEVPTIRSRGQRSGSVSVQGFGEDTSGWIEVATLRLRYDTIQRALTAAGLTVINRGPGTNDLSALLDTEMEPRYQRDFEISYAVVDTDAEELVEALTVQTDLTLEDQENDPDPLVTTIVVTL